MAPSTHQTYATSQRRFYTFCCQAGKLHASGSPCPANEWTLCLFGSFLADSVQHSSIKVNLSVIHSLYIKQGFPDPLQNCLQLQQVLRGIKRVQGSPATQRLPVTDNIMVVIWKALDMSLFDHCMFWTACTLAYFGSLRSAEFTVPSIASFSPSLQLSVRDISLDSSSLPSCMWVRIKAYKTDPFRKGCTIHIGRGSFPLCAVHAMMAYLGIQGNTPGPLFLLQNGQPLSCARLTDTVGSGHLWEFFKPQFPDRGSHCRCS